MSSATAGSEFDTQVGGVGQMFPAQLAGVVETKELVGQPLGGVVMKSASKVEPSPPSQSVGSSPRKR